MVGLLRAQERGRSGIGRLPVQKEGKAFGEVGQNVALGAAITVADWQAGFTADCQSATYDAMQHKA
jgi:hypothetical protein